MLNTGFESSDDNEIEVLETIPKKVCLAKSESFAKSANNNYSASFQSSNKDTKFNKETETCSSSSTSSQSCVGDSLAGNTQTGSKPTPHSIMKDIFPHLSDLAI